MQELIQQIEREQQREAPLPDFGPGDTIKVHYRVREGTRERTQIFEGTVLQVKHSSRARRWCFTVRRISNGVGVERIFPADSPKLEDVEVVRRGRVRRARLFYLRDRVGKKAKVKEARWTPDEAAVAERKAQRKAQRAEKRQAQRDARAQRTSQ
jgi:large subunit ribosomal protein L19